jgi:hypothetical protein
MSGHLGHLAGPETLQEAFVATNTGLESFSFVAARWSLEYLMLWTDKTRIVTYGIASVARYRRDPSPMPWRPRFAGGFRDAEDTGIHGRGLVDGFWRHHRARLHHRAEISFFHARPGLDHDLLHDRRGSATPP